MMQLYAKGTGDTQQSKAKALPHQLDNEEVYAAEAAAEMGAWRARAGSSMGRRWGRAEQSSSEECASGPDISEACERLRAARVRHLSG